LQEIYREDPTRPVTVEWIKKKATMESGFGAYWIFQDPIIACICMMRHSKNFPGIHFGSETASTVSSRGIYKFPVVQRKAISRLSVFIV
jgi:beta-galactosidase